MLIIMTSHPLRQLYTSDRIRFLRNSCTTLALPIESNVIDRFRCWRYLNNHIDLPKLTGSFLSGTTASLVSKNRTKTIIPLLWVKSSLVDRFWYLRCLNSGLDTNFPITPNWVGLVLLLCLCQSSWILKF